MLNRIFRAKPHLGIVCALVLGVSAMGIPAASAQAQVHKIPKNYFWMYNFHSGKCVYVVGASARNGAKLAQGTCKNSREFGFEPKTGFSGSEYFLQESVNLPSAQHHFLCMAVQDLHRGSTLVQEPCNYQHVPSKQRFVFHNGPFLHGYTWHVQQSVASLLCVNIAGASKANGAAVQQWPCIFVRHHSDWFIFLKAGTRLPCPCRSIRQALRAPRRATRVAEAVMSASARPGFP